MKILHILILTLLTSIGLVEAADNQFNSFSRYNASSGILEIPRVVVTSDEGINCYTAQLVYDPTIKAFVLKDINSLNCVVSTFGP